MARVIRTTILAMVTLSSFLLAGCSSNPSRVNTQDPPSTTTTAVAPSSSGRVTSAPSSTAPVSSPTLSYAQTPASVTSPPSKSSPVSRSSTSGSTRVSPIASPEQRFTWRVDSSVPKTKDVQAAITAAIPAYRGFMATYDESLRAPQAQDWEKVMKEYAAHTALSEWRAAWQGNIRYSLHRQGTASAAGRVTAAGATGINMRVCMDFSQVRVVDRAGQPVSIQKGVPEKGFAWLLTITGSKVVALLAQTPSGKTFSC